MCSYLYDIPYIMWKTELSILTTDNKDVKKIKQQNQNSF